jgi:hypothetical protein
MRHGLICAVFLMFTAGVTAAEPVRPARSQANAASTPESVLRGYTDALKAADWQAAARHMHPEALATFQRLFNAIVTADSTGKMARDMFGLAEDQSFESITPEIAFEKVMNMLVTASPLMSEMLKSATATPLGTVREGDVVHVLYRSQMKAQGSTVSKVEVLSTKRDGDNWRALLRGDMESALTALLSRLATKPGG